MFDYLNHHILIYCQEALLIEYFECIPKKGDEIKIAEYKFKIEKVNETRIQTVRLLVE